MGGAEDEERGKEGRGAPSPAAPTAHHVSQVSQEEAGGQTDRFLSFNHPSALLISLEDDAGWEIAQFELKWSVSMIFVINCNFIKQKATVC